MENKQITGAEEVTHQDWSQMHEVGRARQSSARRGRRGRRGPGAQRTDAPYHSGSGFSSLVILMSISMCLMSMIPALTAQTSTLGIFEEHRDIGAVGQKGSVQYDANQQTYLVAGGGENMWFGTDAFHFVWKPVSGDVSLAADIEWLGQGGNAHRKACLLIRQGLEPNAAYVDAVIHGDGLTSLQFRETPGGPTREIQANVSRPKRIGIERRGDTVTLSWGRHSHELEPSGCAFQLHFADPVCVGLGVCAHDNGVLEKAVFANVVLSQITNTETAKPILSSALETIPIGSKDRKVVYHTRDLIEAPNWSRDGRNLFFNSQGRIWKIAVQDGKPERIDTGFATRCNNDHGLSPDGTQLVISDQSQSGGKSLIYLLPVTGGIPRLISPLGPSYWHGWSPDGKTLAYCAERNGNYDIYTIPTTGGTEQRLTTASGLDDGPDYSPDGRWIYFNSDRTGTMHIWRMKPDGSQQEQVTFDEYNDWFPHPSPDGKWLVFLSYAKEVQGHPANKEVWLRLLPLSGGPIQILTRLYGGQGTINAPSWSPDSRQIAFVSYHWSW